MDGGQPHGTGSADEGPVDVGNVVALLRQPDVEVDQFGADPVGVGGEDPEDHFRHHFRGKPMPSQHHQRCQPGKGIGDEEQQDERIPAYPVEAPGGGGGHEDQTFDGVGGPGRLP